MNNSILAIPWNLGYDGLNNTEQYMRLELNRAAGKNISKKGIPQ